MGSHVFGSRSKASTRASIARLFAVLTLMSAGLLAACSQGSDIVLQGPSKPTAPSQPSGPSGPTPSDTGENQGSDTGTNPTHPSVPTPPRPPVAIQEPRYRMFCDSRYPPYLTAVSSLASATGFGAGVEIGEPNRRGVFDPNVDRNLEMHEQAQVVSLPKFGEARVLFSAKRIPKNTNSYFKPRHVFIADVDIVNRGGVAKELGAETRPHRTVEAYGEKEVFSARTLGVSDQGKYLLIGQADGYRVLDSKSLKVLGVVKTGSASLNVNPILRESDMIFTVAAFKGGVFEGKLYSLGISGGVLKTAKLVSSTPNLRRPLVSVGPKAADSFLALDSTNRVVAVSPLKTRASALKLAALPKKGRLSSAITGWRDPATGALHAAVLFENFIPTRATLGLSYKIEQVFVRVVEVDENTLLANAIVPDFDYPSEVRAAIESGSPYQVPGVSDLVTTQDGKAIFALLPSSVSTSSIYRLTNIGFQRVSQTECSRLGVGVELDNGGTP